MAMVLQSTPLFWIRLAALFFSCVAFSVAVHGGRFFHSSGYWCIFCWAFSFVGTLLVLLVELFGLETRSPVSWKNFPITFACYSALLCLSASIIFPLYYVKINMVPFVYDEMRDLRIVPMVFSFLATIAYMAEVRISKARPGEVVGYMATAPGLLKVCETFNACIIFVFISEPILYDRVGILRYCMVVYCVCFIVSAVIIILYVGECTGRLPFSFTRFLLGYAILSVLLYLSATIIWPILFFDPKNGGHKDRPSSCSVTHGLCVWDKAVAVTFFTALNFVLYLVDLLYSTRLVFVKS